MAAASPEDLLRDVTVRVDGGSRTGAGFFMAPGLVVTCVHVVGDVAPITVLWQPDGAPVRVIEAERRLLLRAGGWPIPNLAEAYPDVALLAIDLVGHPCVGIDEDWPAYDDAFQIYGYPDEGGSVTLTPARLSYRGRKGVEPAVFIDLATDKVQPGMSGAALMNLRSGRVCGVVVATRDAANPDGGLAVSWTSVAEPLADVLNANRAFHRNDRRWQNLARPRSRRIRFRLPRVVEHFTGRDAELAAVDAALTRGRNAVITQTLSGLGGIGKSQLAAAYVAGHGDSYDVVAWVRAEGGGVTDLAELAGALGEDVTELSPEERAACALRVLESTERSWLLVLDNVAGPVELSACCPAAGNGRVLITSRHRGLDQFGAVLAVGVLDLDAAVSFLVARTGRDGERAQARQLATALGRLPLALSHAAAYCATGTDFAAYTDLLDGLPAAEVFDVNPEAFYEQTVATTWQVSIDQAKSQARLAVPILSMAAFLAPDAMPKDLFDVLIDTDEIRERKALSDAMGALHRFSLAEAGDATFTVHRLVQKVVRDDAANRQDRSGELAALLGLARAFPQDTDRPASWPRCEQLVPHVLALAERLEQTPSAAEVLFALLDRTCVYLQEAGGGDRSTAAAELTLGVAGALLGPHHPHTVTARANLAFSFWQAGRTKEAIAVEEEVFADRKRLLGPNHPHTIEALANLAVSYRQDGRTADAVALSEQAAKDYERVLGRDDPEAISARANLAVAYREATRTEEAIALGEQVVADYERILGDHHPHTVAARANLAVSYREAGLTTAAIEFGEQVVDDRERLLGADHLSTVRARASLARSYGKAGRIVAAVALLEQVVLDYARLVGPEHPDAVVARIALAGWTARSTGGDS